MILLVLLCAAGFVVLAVWVNLGDTSEWERTWLLSFRESTDGYPMRGPHWLPGIFRDVTSLAGVGLVVLISLSVLVYLLIRGAWRAAVVMLVVLVGTQASVSLLKWAFLRARPDFLEHGAHEMSHSFPSGHSAMSAATALILAWAGAHRHPQKRMKAFFWTVGVIGLTLIGFSRTYLGVHYPTDVLAGWCIGAAWAVVGMWLGCRLDHRRPEAV